MSLEFLKKYEYKLKTKAILIGGVLGCAIMGPTGILIGTKTAVYMATGGGIIGSFIGNKLG